MKDLAPKTFEGYFKIECIKDGIVTDTFEDHNTIMRSARRSMAEVFLNKQNENYQFANKFVLGTEGGTSTEYIPKTEAMGFTKDKITQCLYSEDTVLEVYDGEWNLNKFVVVKYNDKYYRYLSESATVTIDTTEIHNTDDFVEVAKPYVYTLTFDILHNSTYVVGTDSENLATNDSLTNNCSAKISLPVDNHDDVLDQSVCQFVFRIPKQQANNQHTPSDVGYSSNISLFTEAGLYVNNRLFSMKTFPAKVKDDTTEIQITWRIIF